ncbi:MAG: DegT/DnrJ/EryC1/StrS family aminotransferase [Candidatus Hydrogenedens sp.]
MSKNKKEEKSFSTRREFLKSAGVMTAMAGSTTVKKAWGDNETLALFGGKPAVTVSQDDSARWPRYGRAEEDAVLELVRNPSYNPIDKLEEDWKNYMQVPYVKAHFNGTSALMAMFFALNLPPGSEIMVPSYTFFATILPMRLFGLVPVFVDINPQTLNFDLNDAKKRLTANTKAVLPVHWIGLPADMDEINDWAKEKGLIVLEDCAHAHGARLKGKLMGTWSRMAIFSYQMSKPLPAIEGGMGIYQNADDWGRAVAFGDYKVTNLPKDNPYAKYAGSGLGVKLRMHPMAAALARCQLVRLEERNEAGVRQIRKLNDQLLELEGISEQTSGRKDIKRLHYQWNMLFVDEKKTGVPRNRLVEALRAEGVHAEGIHYTLQHELPVYAEDEWWHHKPVIPELPGSKQANDTNIALPYFTKEVPELVEQYVKAFQKVWAHRKELV